jgi:cytochrome c5
MSNQDDAVFIRNFSLLIGALCIVGIMSFILAKIVTQSVEDNITEDEGLSERIAPIGKINTSGTSSLAGNEIVENNNPSSPSDPITSSADEDVDNDTPQNGKNVYDAACFVCHATGVAGAPKLDDTANWERRLNKGQSVLYLNAINGFMGEVGMMPPKGGRPDLSDDAIRAAVDYMTGQ